jgi:hypothetical protein
MSGRLARRIVLVAVPAMLLFAVLPLTAHAASTLNVPAQFPTIQAAINAASDGDTVVVAPGTYAGHIDFGGKAITVESAQGPGSTAIDGGNQDRVVSFEHGESRAAVLQGFTIQHGLMTSGTAFDAYSGGGILVAGASPTIRGNVITNNQAGADGAGIEVNSACPLITGNTITNNMEAPGWSGGGGGGIALGGGNTCSAEVTGNTITHNHSFWGGAMMLNGAGTPTISDNLMSGNGSDSDGGAIWSVNQSDALLVQNLITGNSSPTLGGGMFFLPPSGDRGPFLVSNTIADNQASSGSAVYIQGFASQSRLFNNVLQGGGTTTVDCDTSDGGPTLDHNDVFGASTALTGTCASMLGTNGNISADPKFVGGGNYRLQAGSPAVNAGNNSAPSLPAADFDGLPRIVGGVVDMGAFEFQQGGTPPGGSVSLQPVSLTFGRVRVGRVSTAASITLTDSGNGTLHVGAVSVRGQDPADFVIASNSCIGAALAPGATCSMAVSFQPAASGTRTATLTVASDAPGIPSTVALSGTGR